MQGQLLVVRRRPHFLMITLTLILEEGMDNMSLSRRIHSSVTINQMRRDTEAGLYILDYYVPLHSIKDEDPSYLVDDMVSIQRCVSGQKPEVTNNIRLSLGKDDKFIAPRFLNIIEKDWDGNIIPRS